MFRGWHGLLAYASQHNVVVVDTKHVQLVQCLSKQRNPIRKVSENVYDLRALGGAVPLFPAAIVLVASRSYGVPCERRMMH